MNIPHLSLPLFILLLLSSCTKEAIELPELTDGTAQTDVQLVVEGGISSLPGTHRIRLSTPGVYADPQNSVRPVTGAAVVVLTDDRRIDYVETDEPGTYATAAGAFAPPGGVCLLEVTADGRRYTATDVVPRFSDAAAAEIPVAERLEFDDFLEFSVRFHNFGYGSPGGWLFRGATVSAGDTTFTNSPFHEQLIDRPLVFTHAGASPQGLFPNNTSITGISGAPTDVVFAYRLNFSPAYYAHLVSLLNATDWAAGIFATVPGNAETNVSAGGAGYFYAVNVGERVVALGAF